MHSDLSERCRIARENMNIPPFPSLSIRTAVERAGRPAPRRYSFGVALLAGVSAITIAAAAAVLQHTRVHFSPLGGLVISSVDKMVSRPVHTNAEIRQAAEHLDFQAILPEGLPDGTMPVRLLAVDKSLLVITYNLPGIQRGSHHWLSIVIANPTTMSASTASIAARYGLRSGKNMSRAHWRVGREDVITLSNGLTLPELARIKQAMEQAAQAR